MKSILTMLILTLVLGFRSFGQLDSVKVRLEFVNHADFPASEAIGDLKVNIQLIDMQSIGTVSVDLYQANDNRYLKSIVMTREEIISRGFSAENGLTLTFETLSMKDSYKVETTLQDQKLLYFPPIVNTYNP